MLCFCHFIFGATKITNYLLHKTYLKVHKLILISFKNHSDFRLEMNEDVIAIAGLNGVGKTSVLDAIHFLCIGKSYFSATDVQCIQEGKIQSGVLATIATSEKIELKVKLKRGGRKVIERNGVPYKKVTDHIGEFMAVTIAPGDIELIYGSNTVRRSFINQILCQVDANHLAELIKYNKLIEHRNKHLKEDTVDLALIHTLDFQIAPLAASIYARRSEFLKEFSAVYAEKYHLLSGEKEIASLQYISQLEHNSYAELVAMNQRKDIVVQRSFSGIHKDELELNIGDFPLKKYGSQGQIKTSLIALKIAEFTYLQKATGKTPFLLLDDIFEKIDEERASVLTQIVKNDNFGQIFITDTNEDRLNTFCEEIGKPYKTITLS